jgi:hypothetical protein
MKKYIKLFLLLVLLKDNLFSQINRLNVIYWNDKKLEWSDFQGYPISDSDFQSELNYFIGYTTKIYYINDIKITSLISYCYVDKKLSWAKKEMVNNDNLLFNQIIFDIAELYSRKLQNQINEYLNDKSNIHVKIEHLLIETNSDCKNKISLMEKQTKNGQDPKNIQLWSSLIKSEIDQTPRIDLPDYKLRKFGIGFTGDIGFGLLNGPIKDYFTNNLNLAFGFDLAYQNYIFYLRGTLGFNSVKKEFQKDNKIWPKNLSTGLAIGDISFGYPIIDNNKNRITPFTGIGYIEFSSQNDDEKYKRYRIGKFTYIVGLNYDLKIKKTINLLSNYNEKNDWIIRSRLYFSYAKFNEQLKGSTINLTIGFGGFSRFLKIKT